MGNLLFRSVLKELNITDTIIKEFDDKKIILKHNPDKEIYAIFYFDEDIAKDCYNILLDKKNSPSITYKDSIIYAITIGHRCYPSKKLSPTTFGWTLDTK